MRAVGASPPPGHPLGAARGVPGRPVAAVAGLALGIGIGAGLRALMDATARPSRRPAGHRPGHGRHRTGRRRRRDRARRLAARPPRREDPAGRRDEQRARPGHHAQSLVVRNTLGALIAGAGCRACVMLRLAWTTDGAPMGLRRRTAADRRLRPDPAAVPAADRGRGPVLRLFGVAGKLARQNAVRNPRRTAATASALMIGLTLITGDDGDRGSVQQAIDKMATDSLKADYTVSMANYTPLSPEVAKKLDKLAGRRGRAARCATRLGAGRRVPST